MIERLPCRIAAGDLNSPSVPVRRNRFSITGMGLALAVMAAGLTACEFDRNGSAAAKTDSAPAEAARRVPMGANETSFGNFLAARHAQVMFDIDTAAEYYAKALEVDPENLELLQRTFILMAAEGRLEEAAEAARKVLAYEQDNGPAAIVVAVADVKNGNLDAAESRLSGIAERRGTQNFSVPLVTAWVRAGQGDIDGALDAIRPLADSTGLANLHAFHAGLINDIGGRADAAEEFYRSTLAGNAQLSLRAVQVVGSFYQRNGKTAKARDLYGRYLAQHPDTTYLDDEALLALGQNIAAPIPDAKAGLAEALFGTATSLRQGNAPEAALVFARLALQLDDLDVARTLAADILQNQDRLAEANALYLSIPSESEMYWAARLRAAANLESMEKMEEADSLLREMALERTDRVDPLVALGDMMSRSSRFEEAAAIYGEAIKRLDKVDDRHWALYYSRGISFERSKQWPRAEADFLRALELQPNHPLVLNYLGYSWVEKGVNLDKAKTMIELAVSQRPNDGYMVDSLGWVLYRMGQYEQAVIQLERAVELRPEDPTINDHLGDALWQVGRYDEARFQWNRSLSLDPSPELEQAVRGKLIDGLSALKGAGRSVQ